MNKKEKLIEAALVDDEFEEETVSGWDSNDYIWDGDPRGKQED